MSDTLLMPISTSKTPQRGISAASALRVMKASFLPIRCAMITGFVLALIVSLVPIPALAAPVTVQFEGQAPAGDEVLGVALYSESGFNFNQLGSGDDDFRILSSTFPGLNLSGTDVGFVQEPGNFRITESAGAPFCATSLQLGGGVNSTGTVVLTGTLNGGGTVVENVVIALNTFTDVVLPATWVNLTQIDAVYSADFLVVDNVVLDTCVPTAVPTMSVWSLALLSAMLGLFGLSRRRLK